MKLAKKDLDWAAEEGLLSQSQAEALWTALEARLGDRPKFDLANVAYYFGALIVLGAMGWFMTEAWESFGGLGIFLLAALYATAFALAGRDLWYKRGLRVPGGLFFVLAVWMTPLAIYGLERFTGLWPQDDPGAYAGYHLWVKGSWLLMEAGTVAAGLIALRRIHFPFLTMPIAFSLWYMSMDLTPLLFGKFEFGWDERLYVSIGFGFLILVASYVVDRRTKDDYAFWGYLFGLLAFWGSLSMMESDSELNKFLYCLLNCGLILLSVALERRVFIVFGAVGVFGYLGYLAHRVFRDSLLFPFALSLLGVSIIVLAVVFQKRQAAIEAAVRARIPAWLERLLPSGRGKG